MFTAKNIPINESSTCNGASTGAKSAEKITKKEVRSQNTYFGSLISDGGMKNRQNR